MDIIEAFENAVKKVESWHGIKSSSWLNRLKKIICHPLHYFHYFLYQISKKRLINITAKTFLNTKFFCYLPDYFWTWDYGILGDPSEIKLTRFLLKNIQEGDVILDVGSNCGFYSVLGSFLVGKSGSVHAFEPTPSIFHMLKKNTAELSNVLPVEAAVSGEPGEAEFYLNPLYTVANSLLIKPKGSDYRTTKVRVTTLDDYCYAHNIKPTFIKLDIEGAETAGVLGGQRILTEANPIISLEILDQSSGTDFSAALKLISLGYTPHRLLSNAELEKISLPEIIALYGSKKNDFYNFIFKKL